MSSILDHVEQAVPRATVYGAMKGSPVFIGKYFREINPASNAPSYKWSNGERRISFVVASPDKTIFNDLRSCYLRLDVALTSSSDAAGDNKVKISEPASNCIGRIVIKMNGTVVEDISDFDRLQSFFKRSLLKRDEKNARGREGWDYVSNAPANADLRDPLAGDATIAAVATDIGGGTSDAAALAAVLKVITDDINAKKGPVPTMGQQVYGANSVPGPWMAEQRGIVGDRLCLKLDMSGIMNVQQLLSGYYSPLEIDLYLQDPQICCQAAKAQGGMTALDGNFKPVDFELKNVRLCMDQIVMSPEYVSAFEAALLANSSAQGIQIPFTTYYTYRQNITGGSNEQPTFWIRRPVRYLKGVYWGAYPKAVENVGHQDNYRPCRVERHINGNRGHSQAAPDDNRNARLAAWRIAIGTKNYRQIDDATGLENIGTNEKFHCNESQVMFAKAVGHYNDYATETDELNAAQKVLNNACQGIDLEFSPDNDVLASETTLNSNDVRLEIKSGNIAAQATGYDIYTYLQYQASIALFPGNETRLLVT